MAHAAVEERLAACANILPRMVSVYRWNGAVAESEEAVLILKTEAATAERLAARIKELHDYELPCVLTLPIAGGNQAFLDWIAAETG